MKLGKELFLGGAPFSTMDDPKCSRLTGSVVAIDVPTGKVVKRHTTDYPQLGGLLSNQTRNTPA